MRVKVFLSDGGTLSIDDFDQSSALDLRSSIDLGDKWLTFEMDGDTVIVATNRVIRIDFEGGK